ncbi:MAG: polysaccharide biosynthesis tyrosine autokinase [Gammaproteobacteria bacterium]|nr:polysaccharide biosynthesis tyrosine autokinase [Gammaproteobacteria bacterium]
MDTIQRALQKQQEKAPDENVYPIRNDVDSVVTDEFTENPAIEELDLEVQHAAENSIGEILLEAKRLSEGDIELIRQVQQDEDIYFGEAALQLRLLTKEDIKFALCRQYGYTYINDADCTISEELVTLYKPFHKKSEVLRLVRSQLIVGAMSEGKRIFAVVSPGAQEGKTYIASNLAVTMAQLGKRTLLIDANFRTPRIDKIFSVNARIGLSSMLAGRVSRENLAKLPYAVSTVPNLYVLPTGALPPHPGELLSSHVLPKILGEISTYYDVIFLDTPPGGYLGDVQTVAHAAGQAIVVLRKNQSSMYDSKKLVEALHQAKVDIIGTVFNH